MKAHLPSDTNPAQLIDALRGVFTQWPELRMALLFGSQYSTWRSHALSSLELDRPWYNRMRDAWLKSVAEKGI